MDISRLLRNLTAEEKAALVSGTNFMETNPIPRLNIPSLRMADGPHGLRLQKEGGDNGVSESEPATAFPTAACLASSWNPENASKMGKAIAEECLYYDVNILLGPGMNIKRNPLCGRNFEYFSEDPLLSGKMASAFINGLQSLGVGACVKHFALNNSENFRFMGDSICDARTMQEIYLKPFEIVMRESKPYCVMSAYNKINGVYCSQNGWLLNEILRANMGFDGVVMTDWGAMHQRIESLQSGLDLEMPGDTAICRKWILDGLRTGALKQETIDRSAENVLRLISRFDSHNTKIQPDFEAHHLLAAELAADSAVLLKNDGILPLDAAGNYCIIGDLFERMRYQGAGSSLINPIFLTTPKQAFNRDGIKYTFARGYAENEFHTNAVLLQEAVTLTESFEAVLVFAGLTDAAESEGCDRADMRLPENQIELIDTLAKTGKKIVVVLFGGSPVELPFIDDVSAVLNLSLPGQNGGRAAADLLFGKKCPSGKLAETWVKQYTDVPFGESFGKSVQEQYRESVFVGYRYYETAHKEVRFPFGFGLSYTSFGYSDLRLEEREEGYLVSCNIKNEGEREGAEVIQLYVRSPKGVFKPEKELKGFSKVYLRSGETKRVEIFLRKADLRRFDPAGNRWITERGEYELLLCSDCNTVRLSDKIYLDSKDTASLSQSLHAVYGQAELAKVTDEIFEELLGRNLQTSAPKLPITLDSRFTDFQETKSGRVLFRAVLSIAKKEKRKALKLPQGAERDNRLKGAEFLKRILENSSLATMTMSAGKRMPYNFALGMMHLANGKLLKGLRYFCKKIRVPKLPKDQ